MHCSLTRRFTTSLYELLMEKRANWFLTKLDFRVEREFSFGGMDFVWLCPAESNVPVIE
jgi:hypothetical protein